MNADPRHEPILTLRSGRRVGVLETGDPRGQPVIYCHGFPASRLEALLPAAAARAAGVRLVALDRPGYGVSERQRGRTLTGFAEDAQEVADALGIGSFRLLGVSGGGPYALALLHALPERVRAAAIVCGLGPVWRAEVRAAMHWPGRLAFGSAARMPWLNRLLFGAMGSLMRRQPEAALRMLTVGMREADRCTLQRPEVREVVLATLQEGLRQGPGGALQDLALYADDWGFDPAAIRRPVRFWHGEDDTTVPVGHSRELVAAVPGAQLRVLPGEGHFSLPVKHAREILETLLRD